MDWFKTIRAYWPAIVAVFFSFVVMALLAPLRNIELMADLFNVLQWLPLAGLGYGLLYGLWVTYRLVQAERGDGHLCVRCGGPLGLERSGRFGEYRQCIACGHNVNYRHYR